MDPKKKNVLFIIVPIVAAGGCLLLFVFGGIIAAILVPNMTDALQKAKQKRTIADVRNTGTAWMSWLTDQVTEGVTESTLPEHPTAAELAAVLVPDYIQELPATDGWGHELEFSIRRNLLESSVLRIRSPGRDGVFEDVPIEPRPFVATEYDRDIVWSDGYFMAWPSSSQGSG